MRNTTADEPTPVVVYLGNRNAVDQVDDPDQPGERLRLPLKGKLCTTVRIPAGTPLMEAAQQIVAPGTGVWQAHSDAPAPAWVASTDQALGELLAAHWRCELREPAPEEV
jgi:acyl transferase domain-containing protein